MIIYNFIANISCIYLSCANLPFRKTFTIRQNVKRRYLQVGMESRGECCDSELKDTWFLELLITQNDRILNAFGSMCKVIKPEGDFSGRSLLNTAGSN